MLKRHDPSYQKRDERSEASIPLGLTPGWTGEGRIPVQPWNVKSDKESIGRGTMAMFKEEYEKSWPAEQKRTEKEFREKEEKGGEEGGKDRKENGENYR